MPQIGWFELLLIIGLAVVIIGPKDFPIVLKKIGSWFGSIKRYISAVQSEVSNLEENTLDFRALRSRGNVNRALKDNIEDIVNIRREMVNLLEIISFERMDIVFSHAKSWARQTDQWETIFNELMELLRDLAFFRSGCSESDIFNGDIAKTLKPQIG